MISFIPPRLRKPLGYALVGAVYAAAWALRGGDGWWWSITIIVSWIPLVIGVYVRGGRDTDEGALAGSRADERLRLATTRARALAMEVLMITALPAWRPGSRSRATGGGRSRSSSASGPSCTS